MKLDTYSAAELLGFVIAVAQSSLTAPSPLAREIDRVERAERRAHVEEAVRRIVGHHG